jgi:hypothetical protein
MLKQSWFIAKVFTTVGALHYLSILTCLWRTSIRFNFTTIFTSQTYVVIKMNMHLLTSAETFITIITPLHWYLEDPFPVLIFCWILCYISHSCKFGRFHEHPTHVLLGCPFSELFSHNNYTDSLARACGHIVYAYLVHSIWNIYCCTGHIQT